MLGCLGVAHAERIDSVVVVVVGVVVVVVVVVLVVVVAGVVGAGGQAGRRMYGRIMCGAVVVNGAGGTRD